MATLFYRKVVIITVYE